MIFKFSRLIGFLYFLSVITAAAQKEIPLMHNFVNAVKKQTRTLTGMPGKNYWENFSDYKLNVEVIPQSAVVNGSGIITYYNNSPDTLKGINFKLIQNVHLPVAPRSLGVDSSYFTTGMKVDSLSVDGKPLKWNNDDVNSSDNPTNYFLDLETPLIPGSKINIILKWHYDITKNEGDAREGMIDTGSFFIAYWYPRVSVYDDIYGWDKTAHAEHAEFYNDFGNYDVTIKVPGNYMVLSTGDLKNQRDVIDKNIASRINEAMNNNDINLAILVNDLKNKNFTRPNEFNSWHFIADTVTDFAFGMSNHYLLDAASILVDSAKHRRVLIQTAYDTSEHNYAGVCEWTQQAVNFLSYDLPGIAFPYNKISVFAGHSFMEYPMMVNDQNDTDREDCQATTLHEVAHTYFPFYMGINETRFGWMDEGWAAFFELMGDTRCYKQKNGEQAWADYYCRKGRGAIATPLMVSSYQLTDDYNFNCYGKPALALYTLMNYLGENNFKKCLREYISRWRNKHASPYDYFNSFSDASHKDLNWFWNNWYFHFNYFDLGIKNVKAIGNNYAIMIENIGGKALPVNLKIIFADGSTTSLNQNCDVWKNKSTITITKTFTKKIKRVELSHGIYPDADETNNVFEVKAKTGDDK